MNHAKWVIPFLFLAAFTHTAVAEDISYLPANAVGIRTASVPANEMMSMVEQSGFVPYKGHGCVDESIQFETGPDGRQYGDNEYVRIDLTVMRYKTAYREVFEQLLQMAHPSMAITQEAEKARSEESAHAGLLIKRDVGRVRVDGGEMLLIVDTIRCIESPHESYVCTHFQSFAVTGTTQVNLSGVYNSADAEVAKSIHEKVVAAIKARPLADG
ncbi:MAG: hypothetical protein RB296_05130 [Acidobacteriota bacterium]|jgi:hypothetical protein|nr:hypothetical protein [Acidobacteriota bacterium]